jgi:peptide deformylase
MRGEVLRSQEIVVEYADMAAIKKTSSEKTKTGSDENIPMIRETVNGFTAVIFQHEIDHLDGVLYIDRL